MTVQVRTCRQGIVDYFSNFLQLKPYGTIDKCIIRELAPDVAINSGIYTFKLTRDTGEEAAVPSMPCHDVGGLQTVTELAWASLGPGVIYVAAQLAKQPCS